MSSERHLAGPCEGVSTLRDGSTTTIRFRSEEEARAFDYKLCDALYKALQTPAQPAQDHTAIPEDVMEAARDVSRRMTLEVGDDGRPYMPTDDIEEIARAIMAATEAERERCAKIVAALAKECSEVGSHEGRVSAGLIVRAIRAGTKGASHD